MVFPQLTTFRIFGYSRLSGELPASLFKLQIEAKHGGTPGGSLRPCSSQWQTGHCQYPVWLDSQSRKHHFVYDPCLTNLPKPVWPNPSPVRFTLPRNLTALDKVTRMHPGGQFPFIIEGTIPEEIGQMSSLEYFGLISDQSCMSGTIPGSLTKLSKLDLRDSGNWGRSWRISGIDPKLRDYPHLIPDLLSGSPSLPQSFVDSLFAGKFQNLLARKDPKTTVNLQYNFELQSKLSGTIPPNIVDFTDLKRLGLSHLAVKVSGTFPPSLCSLTKLQLLGLGNSISGTIPLALGRLSDLKVFILNWNAGNYIPPSLRKCVSGVIPAAAFAALNKLTYLDLSGTQLQGRFPSYALTSPTFLQLPTGVELPIVPGLRKLESLTLQSSIPDSISVLSGLKELSVGASGPTFTGTIPTALGELTQIENLQIVAPAGTGIPTEISKLSRLTSLSLWVSGNRRQR